MKKTWKVFLCTTLVMCTLSSACIFGATNDADQSSTLPVEASQNDTGISSRANFLSLDISITGYDYAWRQMDGYTSFRAWVENTTDALMIVTITYPSGKTKNLYVTAGNSTTYTNNNAEFGIHTVSFYSYADSFSGTMRVRVSTTPL